MRGFNKYIGLTYPNFLSHKILRWAIYPLWKKFLCSEHIHLFDEIVSAEHLLHCDVCGFSVHIASTETENEARQRAKNGLYIETAAIEKSETDNKHMVWLKQWATI